MPHPSLLCRKTKSFQGARVRSMRSVIQPSASPTQPGESIRTMACKNRSNSHSLAGSGTVVNGRGKEGCIPDYCASSKAKRLKQLRPGLTERSRAECRHRQRPPFGLLNPFSASTPFHLNEKLGCTHAREARVGTEAVGLRFFRPRTTIYSIAITLSTENAQNAQLNVRLDTVEVPVSAPRAGESKNGGGISAASGLMGRLQATCGARRSAVPCKQLRAFTSVFERARSRFVAFSRV